MRGKTHKRADQPMADTSNGHCHLEHTPAAADCAVLIEVTPEMIEAGDYWLDQYDHDYSDAATYLTHIFRAMEAARCNPAKPR